MTIPEPELPAYYYPNSRLCLQLNSHAKPLFVNVIHAITPFTMSQLIVVEASGETPEHPELPSSFIVKIYDPRFFDHRRGRTPRPWTAAAEAAAAQKRTKWRDPDFKAYDWPEDEDAEGWEEWYYQNAEMQYDAEDTAYQKLAPLQGAGIPRCYGTGTLEIPDRAISPHFLLLELIPNAKRLDQVDPQTVDASVANSLIHTAEQLGVLGVVHTDLNPGNILFSPGERPTRAVVIDFGGSGYREEESDEEWAEIVDQNADVMWMKKRLARSSLSFDLETSGSQVPSG